MSIIKTCGGYDKAKIYVEQFKKLNLDGAAKLFEDELLEYRRAKNIIDIGDKVFLDETGDEIQTVTERNKELFYNLGFTHATDIEIAQGYRS